MKLRDDSNDWIAAVFTLSLIGLYCVYCVVKSYIIITHYIG